MLAFLVLKRIYYCDIFNDIVPTRDTESEGRGAPS